MLEPWQLSYQINSLAKSIFPIRHLEARAVPARGVVIFPAGSFRTRSNTSAPELRPRGRPYRTFVSREVALHRAIDEDLIAA